MGKRGQFTIFVILGIVIILAFAFLFFIRSILVTDQLDAEADKIFDEFIQTSSVNTYVSSCVSEIFEDSLVTITAQGGVIYTYQNGTIPIGVVEGIDFFPYEDTVQPLHNISYGLVPNVACSLVQLYPPNYPRPFTFLDDLPQHYYESPCRFTNLGSGFFGTNNLTKLCAHDGANMLGAGSTPLQLRTCETGTYNLPGKTSVQDQLQEFLEDQLPRCVNLSTFLERFNTNITPLGDPNVSITWGDGSVTVKATYPLQMVVDGVPISTNQEFTTPFQWDVKNLYNFVFFLLVKDASDPYFSIQDHYSTIRFYRTAYNVTLIRNPCLSCTQGTFDDLLIVEDNSMLIKGKPLRFQVAIKNRRPALEWIPKPRYTADNDLDILTLENRSIEIKPLGLDPDDTTVWYNYSGWKETHNSTFNFDKARLGQCTEKYLQDCVILEPGEPRNWSTSDWFVSDKRTARYRTNRNDTGYHEVNITVWDEEGLKDFQSVHILVFDLPRADINGTNTYADVGDWNASIEDPFFLNGSRSNASVLGGGSEQDLTKFSWNDTDEPFSTWTTESTVWVPFVGSYENIDIIDIIKRNFTFRGRHEIILEVVENIQGLEVSSAPSSIEIQVRACLPHRDPSPSFPYEDSAISDPFQANHTCCTDDFGIRTAGTCFSEVTYGSMYAIEDNQQAYALPDGLVDVTDLFLPGGVTSFDQVAESRKNDIFRRSFSRSCSGDRGNICSGTGTDLVIVQDTCDDTKPLNGERCEGPANVPLSDAPLSCVQYGAGTTFESLFVTGGPGFCGPSTQSTTTSYGDATGNFKCQGYCDGSGGCTQPTNCVCEMPNDHPCDGLPEPNLPTSIAGCARAGETYFQDICTNSCELGDNTVICRSADFHATCSAVAECNGVRAGDCVGRNRRCTTECVVATDPRC